MSDPVPYAVLAAWGIEAATIEPITIGLINTTYRVSIDGTPRLVLQRLHPIFAGEVNLDIDAITAHLEAKGMRTPRLARTQTGAPWIEHDGVWRALTFLDGVVHTTLREPSIAH